MKVDPSSLSTNPEWFCATCEEDNRKPIVHLDRFGRCNTCGSETVMPHVMPHQENVTQGIIYWP